MWIRIVIVTLVLATLSLMGCETIQGAGEDIEQGGEAMEEAIEGEEAQWD